MKVIYGVTLARQSTVGEQSFFDSFEFPTPEARDRFLKEEVDLTGVFKQILWEEEVG